MSLDFSQHYRLRKPKVTDSVDILDFNRFFSGNQDIIDAELHRLSEAVSALESGAGNAPTPDEIGALRTAFDGLQAYVDGFADRIAELETNAGTASGTGDSTSVDLSGINSAIAQLNSTVSGLQATVEGYGTRLSALEAWRAGFAENASGSGSAGGSSSGSDSGSDTSGLTGQILALRRNVEADMLIMSNRLVLLESAAFTDFSVDETDYKWYARNIKGIAVDGPFEFGFVNSSKSLAELLGLTPDSGDNGDSSGGIVLEPEEPRSLAEIFGFAIE